jgi:hypothetical protein
LMECSNLLGSGVRAFFEEFEHGPGVPVWEASHSCLPRASIYKTSPVQSDRG